MIFSKRNNVWFLLIIDSKFRWSDIHIMSKVTGLFQTKEKLKITSSVMGLSHTIGNDFNAHEFKKFCHINIISCIITLSPRI